MRRMTGTIFSDLGAASSFMALDWVQLALKESLGFAPFPATLNIRPKDVEDAATWRLMRSESSGLPLAAAQKGFCSARLYSIEILEGAERLAAAILVPEVKDYPDDKIEIIAPVRLKDHLGVCDGDAITLEFLN
jgi:riboflavin kinase, archaea type